jgi:hypothetical protein
MFGRVLGEETLSWWGIESVSNVGEDLRRLSVSRMGDDTNSELVGTALEAYRNHPDGGFGL